MENLLEDFYINLEETRNKVASYHQQEIQSAQVIDCHVSLDSIYRIVQELNDAAPLDNDHVYVAMVESCTVKASQLSKDVLELMTNTDNTNANAGSSAIDDGSECQQAIAQMMEIAIRLSLECNASMDNQSGSGGHAKPKPKPTFAERYSEYQRTVLRNRSKPAIAALANIRKVAMSQSISVIDYIQSIHDNDEHGEHDNDAEKRPHAISITVILGEASSLIHPLILWKDGISNALHHLQQQDDSHAKDTKSRVNSLETNVQSTLLQMCNLTIATLHKEAQNLSKSVGEWFLLDTANISAPLDSNLDEMAFICQVLHRYTSFTNQLSSNQDDDNDNSILSQHLAEQILQYTINETKLISSNIERAIELAQPVQIIMGTDRHVPSVVEDAYYISQRSLERASGTMASSTISMLANFVVEVWSVHGGVYNALMEQKGCYTVRDAIEEKPKEKKAPNSFNLFLNALDQDMGTAGNGTSAKAPGTAPSSGGVDMHRVQIDTQFCLLNGIHAASSACISLSNFFDSLLSEEETETSDYSSPSSSEGTNTQINRNNMSKEASMITCAKEQLQSHCNAYNALLDDQITQFLQEWIGTVTSTEHPPPLIASLPHSPSIHRLFFYISRQEYNLNATTLQKAESDENTKQLLSPFQESRLMVELRNGKCDDGVTLHLIQIMSHQVVNIFLSTLLNQKQKQFSEWGSLLLSKQIRTLEEFFCSGVIHQNGEESGGNTSMILREFQKLAQAVTILQCGKPMDWTAFEDEVSNTEFDLSKAEIRRVMGLRIDWSVDAIHAVCK